MEYLFFEKLLKLFNLSEFECIWKVITNVFRKGLTENIFFAMTHFVINSKKQKSLFYKEIKLIKNFCHIVTSFLVCFL